MTPKVWLFADREQCVLFLFSPILSRTTLRAFFWVTFVLCFRACARTRTHGVRGATTYGAAPLRYLASECVPALPRCCCACVADVEREASTVGSALSRLIAASSFLERKRGGVRRASSLLSFFGCRENYAVVARSPLVGWKFASKRRCKTNLAAQRRVCSACAAVGSCAAAQLIRWGHSFPVAVFRGGRLD